jgi:hypothetical protein
MRKVLFLAFTVSLVIAFAQPGFAQVERMVKNDVKAAGGIKVGAEEDTATVDSVDYENRTGTLKLPDGTITIFRANPEVNNFDQLKVGDKVLIRK